MKKRSFCCAVIVFITLSACGSEPTYKNAIQTVKSLIVPPNAPAISRSEVERIPYAMISARVGKLEPALLILGHTDGAVRQWFSTNEVSVTTRNGRLIQTVGFDKDIREFRRFGEDPLSNQPHKLQASASFSRSIQGWSKSRTFTVFDCVLQPGTAETIIIAEISFETLRLEESCTSESGDQITGTYWVDPYDGLIWRSRQSFGEDTPDLVIEVLKPATIAD